jgi:MFS family permease
LEGIIYRLITKRGVFVSFGVFQSYYITKLQRDPSEITWIGSVEIFLLFFLGTFSGYLTDTGYFRTLVISGAFLTALGNFMASICQSYWQLFLAQGVCVGLGNGLLFAPTMSVVSTYFQERRALAMGIAACGSMTGGLIFPSMARTLLPSVGFGWTMRAIGFIQLVTLLTALIFIKPRIPPRSSRLPIDWQAFKEAEYTLYAIASFLVRLHDLSDHLPLHMLTPSKP